MNTELAESGDKDQGCSRRIQSVHQTCGIGERKSRGDKSTTKAGQSDGSVGTTMGCCLLCKEGVTDLHGEVPLFMSS